MRFRKREKGRHEPVKKCSGQRGPALIRERNKHLAAMRIRWKTSGIATRVHNQNAEIAQNRFRFLETARTATRPAPPQDAPQTMKSTSAAANPPAVLIRNHQAITDLWDFARFLTLPNLKLVALGLLIIRGRNDQIVPRFRHPLHASHTGPRTPNLR